MKFRYYNQNKYILYKAFKFLFNFFARNPTNTSCKALSKFKYFFKKPEAFLASSLKN